MDELPPSVRASGVHIAENDIVHQTVTQSGDAVIVCAVLLRRNGRHRAKETLHIEGHFGIASHPYLFATIQAEQCCRHAPQDDVRYDLFKPGTYVVDGERDWFQTRQLKQRRVLVPCSWSRPSRS